MIAWPVVAARLAAVLPTLPGLAGVDVFDGPPVTAAAPVDYVTVGYVDDESAGRFEREPIYDGAFFVERGEVACHVVAQSGDTDIAETRARAFAIADAIDTWIRADRTLGVLSADGFCTVESEVSSVQNSAGSAQAIVLTVSYTTRS